MKSIKLGSAGPGAPVGGSLRDSAPEEYYPTAHITVPEDEVEMPDEGTVTFKYKVRRETTVNRPNGEKVCEYDLDLTELVKYKKAVDERPAKSDTSAGDALDKLAKEKSEEKNEDY